MKMKSLLFFGALTLGSQAFAAQEISFTNKELDGVKVWEPSTTTLKAGEDLEIKLINTLKDVHGFQIPELTDPIAVPGNETKVITVKAPKAGEYSFKCHMHPKHKGGSLQIK